MYVCMYIMLATTLFNRYVVNYDFPRNIEDYVHRVGRTGRAGWVRSIPTAELLLPMTQQKHFNDIISMPHSL